MRPLLVLGLLLLPTLAAADESPRQKKWLHWGIACSIAADTADLISTVYAFQRHADIVEANFLLGEQAKRLETLLPIKAAGAGVVNGTAIWQHDDSPVLALALVYSNCAIKTAVAIHNFRVALRPSAAPVMLTLRVRW